MNKPFRIALVGMPFADAYRPSIQLGLLKSILNQQGFECETFHFYLDFASRIGLRLHATLSEYRGAQFGEWVFAQAAFGPHLREQTKTFTRDFRDALLPVLGKGHSSLEAYERVANEVCPAFIEELLTKVDWSVFSVVGFTSTFQQNNASFALARRVKERFPEMTIVLGGANFDGEMGREWVEKLPFVDFVISGEGDRSFPRLLECLREKKTAQAIPGVNTRECISSPPKPETLQDGWVDLDALPVPDYDEYFEQFEALGFGSMLTSATVTIPFESARGCWWGQKRHCTFCGLNGATMQFRSKTPARVLNELSVLASRYGTFNFAAVDNIMDAKYFATFLRELKEVRHDYSLFYEVKANLSRAHLKALQEAGVNHIQPGIESFSTHVLSLMKKGVRGIQNINLLRWARYYGMDVAWNLLWGFPGETVEDYDWQCDLIPSLLHLQPPGAVGRVWMERFSPFFVDRKAFPTEYLAPEKSYFYIYPATVDLSRVAYFFDYKFEKARSDAEYGRVISAVNDWKSAWKGRVPELRYSYTPGLLRIEDRRDSNRQVYELTGALADFYFMASDAPTTVAAAVEKLGPETETQIRSAVDALSRARLLVCEEDLCLALALPTVHNR